MERVTGIGGVFFRSRDPTALVAWYAEQLGVPVDDGYVVFPESRNTVWAPFSADTTYSADKHGMVNFTVLDLDAMLEQLRRPASTSRSTSRSTSTTVSAGRHPEGNRFELWQPS